MTQKCRACGKEVDITATTCPHCGAKNPTLTAEEHYAYTKNKFTASILWALIPLAVFIFYLIGRFIGYNM